MIGGLVLAFQEGREAKNQGHGRPGEDELDFEVLVVVPGDVQAGS